MAFDEVVGQKLAITILQNALREDRLSHAYLFTGEAGVGKEIAAFEFAKAINCKNDEIDSCGRCISCRKADSNNHPDIKEIRPDGASIKIDQIRKLQQEILYKPYESSKKVYIIYQADKMNLQAANSLLKTLEEPPSYATIILVADNLKKLLSTVISRCQLVRFKLVSDSLIKDKLKSEYKLSDDKCQIIISLVAGRYKQALELVEDENKLKDREEILELVSNFKDLNRIRVFEVVNKLPDDRDKLNDSLNIILTWYRDLLLVKLEQKKSLVNMDYYDQLINEANYWSFEGIKEVINLIDSTNNLLREINVNLQLTLEVMMLKLNRLRRKNYDRSTRNCI